MTLCPECTALPFGTCQSPAMCRMTARQIIGARLGRKLPATRALRLDERQAIKRLAVELLRARAESKGNNQ